MKYVAYYRVSTKVQGWSGLGLDAQKETVQGFVKDAELLNEYIEIESGKCSENRPVLKAALRLAQDNDAVLIIAKLDRLSRNVAFISALMDAKVKFICCDAPDANEFNIHILASFAQMEAKRISERTCDALAALKKKGVKLGNPYKGGERKKDGTRAKVPFPVEDRLKAWEVRKKNIEENENVKRALVVIISMKESGNGVRKIVNVLNTSGFKTSQNCFFTITQVKRIYKRYLQQEEEKRTSPDFVASVYQIKGKSKAKKPKAPIGSEEVIH